MTYNAACILYYKWLGQPGNDFMLFIPWYHEQGITIESDAHTKALIKATGYPGHSISSEIINWVEAAIANAFTKLAELIDNISRGIDGTIETILAFFNNIWAARNELKIFTSTFLSSGEIAVTATVKIVKITFSMIHSL